KEGIPFGRVADSNAAIVADPRVAEKLPDQLVGLVARERLERDRLPAPGRPPVDQLRPGETEKQERCVSGPVGEMLDEVEQRRLGPVDVLDDQCQRPLARTPLERLPDGP